MGQQHDSGTGSDAVQVAQFPGPAYMDTAKWRGVFTIEKYDRPVEWYLARLLGITEADIARHGGFTSYPADARFLATEALISEQKPYEVLTIENGLLNAGITAMWNLIIGNGSGANTGASPAGASAAYNNAQARIGVGDSSTAYAASQTDLQAATNKYLQGMDATFPSVSAQTVTYRITVGGANANFTWNEIVADNCNGSNSTSTTRSGGATMSRAVSSMGTKGSGSTWIPTYTVTLS